MTYKNLKSDLDRLFASFIRLRDEDKPCISCGKYTNLEAGHYYPRANLPLRWDEMNVFGQCIDCNRFKSGNRAKFGRGIAVRCGEDVIEYLDERSHARVSFKSPDLLEKIDHYRNKLKNFKKDSG